MPFTCDGASGLTSGLPTFISSPFRRLRVELIEETLQLLPQLPAAGESAPMGAHQPDERVAVVDRHEPVRAGAARTVHEQCLDVGRHRGEYRVGPFDLRPGVELELRLRRTHRARVVSDHAAGIRVMEEERHVNRNAQPLPLEVGELELQETEPPLWHQPVLAGAGRLAIEQKRARPARTDELAVAQIQQVPMAARQRRGTELAALSRSL